MCMIGIAALVACLRMKILDSLGLFRLFAVVERMVAVYLAALAEEVRF